MYIVDISDIHVCVLEIEKENEPLYFTCQIFICDDMSLTVSCVLPYFSTSLNMYNNPGPYRSFTATFNRTKLI